MTDEVLYTNQWVSLKRLVVPELGIQGYIYSHETRCDGIIVAILPFRKTNSHVQYLLKSEVTPCWDFTQPILSAITGGYESDPEADAVRELAEETGYQIAIQDLIALGFSRASKSADTVYHLFSVDVSGKKQGEAVGDGSRLESESKAVWVDEDVLLSCVDPQVSVMLFRLKNR